MIRLTAVHDPTYLDEVVAAIELDALDRLELVMQQLGQEVKDYLVSLTEETVAGWPDPDGPVRQAHPGHWADRSGQLALSYSFEVIREERAITLVFRNTSEYAFWVEAMDGFFVLSGVLEPGGPVETALVAIVARLVPEWRVVTGNLHGLRVADDVATPNVGGVLIPLEGGDA